MVRIRTFSGLRIHLGSMLFKNMKKKLGTKIEFYFNRYVFVSFMVGIQLVKTLKVMKVVHLFRYKFLNLKVNELNADLCVSKAKTSQVGKVAGYAAQQCTPGHSILIQYENTEVNYSHKNSVI
jgi:hypothetical protein